MHRSKKQFGSGIFESRKYWKKRCGNNYEFCSLVVPNLRLHYFDTRFLKIDIKSFFGGVTHPLSIVWFSNSLNHDNPGETINFLFGHNPSDFIMNCRKLFDICIGSDLSVFIKENKEYKFSKPNIFTDLKKIGFHYQIFPIYVVAVKVNKELNKLDNLNKINFVETFWDVFSEKIINGWKYSDTTSLIIKSQTEISKNLKYLPLKQIYDNKSFRANTQNMLEYISKFTCHMVTDLYLLARVFIRYDKSSIKSHRACSKQSYNKNIIIYGGDAHIGLLNDVINKLFSVKPLVDYNYSVNNFNMKCVDFEKKLQFF